MSVENIIRQYNEMWTDPRYEFVIYIDNPKFYTHRIRQIGYQASRRCRCKFEASSEKNAHHRLSKALGGTNSFPKDNLIKVSKYRHNLWTTIFPGDYTLTMIAAKTEEILEKLGIVATVGFRQK